MPIPEPLTDLGPLVGGGAPPAPPAAGEPTGPLPTLPRPEPRKMAGEKLFTVESPATGKVDPKRTMVAPRQAQATMVAKGGVPTQLAPAMTQGDPIPEEATGQPPRDPKVTMIASHAAPATMLAPPAAATTLASPEQMEAELAAGASAAPTSADLPTPPASAASAQLPTPPPLAVDDVVQEWFAQSDGPEPSTSEPAAITADAGPDSAISVGASAVGLKDVADPEPPVDLASLLADDESGEKAPSVKLTEAFLQESKARRKKIEEDSAVDLGQAASAKAEPSRSRPPQKAKPAEDALPVQSDVLRSPRDESSAVDLGSDPSVKLSSSKLPEVGVVGLPEVGPQVPEEMTEGAVDALDQAEEPEIDVLAADVKGGPKEDAVLGAPSATEGPIDPDQIDFEEIEEVTTPQVVGDVGEPPGEGPQPPEEGDDGEPRPRAAKEAKAPPKPRYGRRWVGGTLVGTVLGAAASVGLLVYNVVPYDQVRATLEGVLPGIEKPTVARGAGGAVQTALRDLRNGDITKALPVLDSVVDATPDLLAARGEARWLAYLQKQAGNPPKKDDPEVAQAIADLTKAKNPRAYFWLGYIAEATGDLDLAREHYRKGVDAPPDPKDPAAGKLCEAALERLHSMPDKRPVGAGACLPEGDPGRLLAVLLLALQAPAGAAPPDQAGDEAGMKFWQAARLAKEHRYDEARKVLDEARRLHDKRRFLFFRRAQNPTSDPTEEIFLRTCDELSAYWRMRDLLHKGGYDLAMFPSAVEALDKLLADKKNVAGDEGKALKAVADKLGNKDEKPKLDDVLKAIDQVLADKKAADDTVAAVTADLTEAKFVNEERKDPLQGLKALLKEWKDTTAARKEAEEALAKAGARLEAAGFKDASLDKGIDRLAGAHADTLATLGEVAKRLEAAGFLPPKASKDQMLQAVAQVINDAYSPIVSMLTRLSVGTASLVGGGTDLVRGIDLTRRLALSQAEAARYAVLLRESRPAREMVELWVPLLLGPTVNPDLLAAAS
ncbi:MAG: hypothetical protein NZ700_02905, partial [Gemmataceae bacterium]|nr:hypothetical protein [Gemmataceae bacterium]